MLVQRFREILSEHVPKAALDYCVQCWINEPFSLKVLKERSTKLGDFRTKGNNSLSTITVNNNLNPYSFLITYIHEYAHLVTFKKYNNRVAPHGIEWKMSFRKLMLPLLGSGVFPESLDTVLGSHMNNPKASSQSDPNLVNELAKYDEAKSDLVTVDSLAKGNVFEYKSKFYIRNEKRRTRIFCKCIEGGKIFLFHFSVKVKLSSLTDGLQIEQNLDFMKLGNLPNGNFFTLNNKSFKKIELRRIKVLCESLDNNRQYLIHKDAIVEVLGVS